MVDGLSLNTFALFEDGFGPAEVGVGARHVIQALVIRLVIVVLDSALTLVKAVQPTYRRALITRPRNAYFNAP